MNYSDLLKEIKGKKVKDIIASTNKDFFKWLKRILKLDPSRTVQVCTYMLNYHIWLNFFPWFKALETYVPIIKEKYNLQDNLFGEYKINTERIFGIIILFCLKYKWKEKYNRGNTDKEIDKLWSYGPLTQTFFVLNSLPYELDLEGLLQTTHSFFIRETLLPDLHFDPDFRQITESRAVKQLYDISFIQDFFQFGIINPRDVYPIPLNLFQEAMKACRDRGSKLFSINPELKLSKFFRKESNYTGLYFLSSHQQIDEIMQLFTKYYSEKIPFKKNEIKNYLLCFGELLKLTEGKMLKEISWASMKERLQKLVDNNIAEVYLQYAFLGALYKKFDIKDEDFNGKDFLKDYHDYLSKTGYIFSGKISTGIFLVWRALIKYLETLQKEETLKNKKGSLLELWCYENAVEKGFRVEKLILINPKNKPSYFYKKMLKQTNNFPRRLQLKAKFLGKDINSYFREFDLVIKLNEYLIIFECKATSAPIGEIGDYIQWIENLQKNYLILKNKTEILDYNIKNGIIKHRFLKGVSKFIHCQIQTEGIFTNLFTMTTRGYLKFLDALKINHENNSLEAFFHEYLRPF